MKKVVLLVLLACVCVLPAHADTLNLVSEPFGSNSPYGIQFGNPPAPPTILMVCFSDANHLSLNEQWTASAFTVAGGLSAVVGTIFGQSTLAATITQYNTLGFLANELFASPGNAELQDAEWHVGIAGASTCDATCLSLVAAAQAAVAGGFTTSDIFWIPTLPGGGINNSLSAPQPLIQNNQVAEPGLLLMLGSGLLGLIGFGARRRNELS